MIKTNPLLDSIEGTQIREIYGLLNEGDINFSLGIPNFPPPQHVKDAISRANEENYGHFYGPAKGSLELRQEIKEHYNTEYSQDLKIENIVITAGCTGSLHCMRLLKALANEHDKKVMVPELYFPAYVNQAISLGIKPVYTNLNKNFHLDLNKLEANIQKYKPQSIIINSPNNPTGVVYSGNELGKMVEICSENNVFIESDEVYMGYILDGNKHNPISRFANLDEAMIHNSFSKWASMTGDRIGFTIADKCLIDKLGKVSNNSITCPNTLGQYGALEFLKEWNESKEFLKDKQKKLKETRDYMIPRLNGMGLKCKKSEGSFFEYVEINEDIEVDGPYDIKSLNLAYKFLENGVGVAPDVDFSSPDSPLRGNYMRVSFSVTKHGEKITEDIPYIEYAKEGLEKMENTLNS